jgi:hypothetical protein
MGGVLITNSPLSSINRWLYRRGATPMQTKGGLMLMGMYIPSVMIFGLLSEP